MPDKFARNGEIFEIYQRIYMFHKKYANAEKEWVQCAAELKSFKTPLEVDLVVAVMNELERRQADV